MKFLTLPILLLAFAPLNSCTSAKKMSDNQKSRGHFRLYSYPDKKIIKPAPKNAKRIVIVSANNLEGSIWPEHFNIPNKFKDKRVVSIGGIEAMKAYSDVFKKVFENQVLFVDGGSFYHPEKDYIKTAFLYNYVGLDVAGLGTKEFSFSPRRRRYLNKLDSVTSKLETKVLTSNLFDLTTAEKAKLRYSDTSTIKEINGVKIGFLSTLSQQTAKKVPAKNFLGLYVQDPASTIITKAESLKRSGAQIIVLLTNSNIDCASKLVEEDELPAQKVNFDPYEEGVCNTEESELSQTLSKLPPRTVDLVITSDGETKVANFIHDIPVMQNSGKGQFYSFAEIFYDDLHKVVLSKKTRLHQPVQLCHQFLEDNQDCYLEESLNNKEVVPAKFLGIEIKIDPLPAK